MNATTAIQTLIALKPGCSTATIVADLDRMGVRGVNHKAIQAAGCVFIGHRSMGSRKTLAGAEKAARRALEALA